MEKNVCVNQMYGSFQKWFIGNYVRQILIDDEDLKERIGLNVYPLVAPEGVKGDFITYQRVKYSKTAEMHGNVYMDECRLQLLAVSDNYDDAVELSSLIDNALTGKFKTKEGDRFSCELADSYEDFADGKFIETLEYRIK